MTAPRLLLVEDEPGLVRTLGDLLRQAGYSVEHAVDGPRGLELAQETPHFDVVLLDVMLPRLDGFEVCRTLRRKGVDTPILMLTARAEVSDRVHGLRLGADDYLTKPFDPDELLARIEALLRRTGSVDDRRRITFGDIEVDLNGMSVRRGGEDVPLAAMEFQLLAYLIENEGAVLTRETILREVWGFHRPPRTRTVDVHVTWLRSKLEPDRTEPRFIRTVRGIGYKFVTGEARST